jgi:hypothetical protein
VGTKPLSSFAAPGAEPLKSEKPVKPFGAPDSESEADEEEDEEREESEQPPEAERAVSPEKESEEKKKLKLQKGECPICLFIKLILTVISRGQRWRSRRGNGCFCEGQDVLPRQRGRMERTRCGYA